MQFSETELIRFVKTFAASCIEKNSMPSKSDINGLQFLYYRPFDLLGKTYKNLDLKKSEACFIVYSTHVSKIIFSTQDFSKNSICDMYETASNHLDTIN